MLKAVEKKRAYEDIVRQILKMIDQTIAGLNGGIKPALKVIAARQTMVND